MAKSKSYGTAVWIDKHCRWQNKRSNELTEEEHERINGEMFNFIDYLHYLAEYAIELELPFEKVVKLIDKGKLKGLGWAKESEHILHLAIMFGYAKD